MLLQIRVGSTQKISAASTFGKEDYKENMSVTGIQTQEFWNVWKIAYNEWA